MAPPTNLLGSLDDIKIAFELPQNFEEGFKYNLNNDLTLLADTH